MWMQMRQEEPNNKIMRKGWTMKETIALFEAVKIHGTDWSRIVEILPGRSMDSVRNHWFRSQKRSVDEHPVQNSRDLRPLSVDEHPASHESHTTLAADAKITLETKLPGEASADAPREKHCLWTPQEDLIIKQSVAELGARWREVAKQLPGRTESSVRNRWKRIGFQNTKPAVGGLEDMCSQVPSDPVTVGMPIDEIGITWATSRHELLPSLPHSNALVGTSATHSGVAGGYIDATFSGAAQAAPASAPILTATPLPLHGPPWNLQAALSTRGPMHAWSLFGDGTRDNSSCPPAPPILTSAGRKRDAQGVTCAVLHTAPATSTPLWWESSRVAMGGMATGPPPPPPPPLPPHRPKMHEEVTGGMATGGMVSGRMATGDEPSKRRVVTSDSIRCDFHEVGKVSSEEINQFVNQFSPADYDRFVTETLDSMDRGFGQEAPDKTSDQPYDQSPLTFPFEHPTFISPGSTETCPLHSPRADLTPSPPTDQTQSGSPSSDSCPIDADIFSSGQEELTFFFGPPSPPLSAPDRGTLERSLPMAARMGESIADSPVCSAEQTKGGKRRHRQLGGITLKRGGTKAAGETGREAGGEAGGEAWWGGHGA